MATVPPAVAHQSGILSIFLYGPVRLARPESVPNLSREFSRLLAEQAAARQQLRTLNGNSGYVTK
jgi:hypothetical protein